MDLIVSALHNLRTNKLRTALTALGVIIGVASVVVMVSIVEGARRRVVQEFENLGVNLIFAIYLPEQEMMRSRRFAPSVSFQGLTMDDVRAIDRNCDRVALLSPEMRFLAPVKTAHAEGAYRVMGVTEVARRVFRVRVIRGRGLNRRDVASWARVCVLGHDVARELFPETEAVGQEVTVRGLRLKIVGVLERKGSALGENRDDYLYIPLTVMHRCFLGTELLASIVAKATSPEHAAEAADQIWRVLAVRHRNINDFVVDTQDSMLTAVGRILNLFLFVLGGIGALSLLTGGIGIMNIMLVSVTERTREIGIRRAVGAKQRDIFLQFLVESVTLSGMGGVIGLLLGIGLSHGVDMYLHDRLPTFIPVWSVALAFGCAAAVGVFFGSYPARRAARLDPIEALRYE